LSSLLRTICQQSTCRLLKNIQVHPLIVCVCLIIKYFLHAAIYSVLLSGISPCTLHDEPTYFQTRYFRIKLNPDEKITKNRILGVELPLNAVNSTSSHKCYTSFDEESKVPQNFIHRFSKKSTPDEKITKNQILGARSHAVMRLVTTPTPKCYTSFEAE